MIIALFFFASLLEPAIGVLTIVILVSSIVFEEALPLIPIGVGSFHVTDVLLLFLLGLSVFKKTFLRKYVPFKTPLDRPLLFFYSAALISAGIAIAYFDVTFNLAMRELRLITYYLLFFVCKNLIREKKQIQIVVVGLLVIATVVATAMMIQALIGEDFQFMPGRVEAVNTLEQKYETIRIIPPGEFLLYVVFVTVFCVIFSVKSRTLIFVNSGVLLILGVGVVLTYTRILWFTIFCLLAIFIMVMAHRKRMRIIVPTILLVIVLAGILNFGFGKDGARMNEYKSSISDRLLSMLNAEELMKSDSVGLRKMENRYAIKHIMENMLFGIGLGNKYRHGGEWKKDEGNYIHNGYLYIILKMGLLGFIPFVIMSAVFVVRGILNRNRINDLFLRGILNGFTLSYLGLIIILFYSPKVMEFGAIPVIAVLLGIGEGIIKSESIRVSEGGGTV
jgi:O-antigen ligase